MCGKMIRRTRRTTHDSGARAASSTWALLRTFCRRGNSGWFGPITRFQLFSTDVSFATDSRKSRSSRRPHRRRSWRAACRSSTSNRTRAARSRSTCRSRRRRPRRAPAPRRSSSRRSTAPMRRRRPRRTSWASRGGRRVPPTCRSSIWPARRVRRRRLCRRADGRHHLLRRRSLESSRFYLLYLGRRRLHRLPGGRRHRLRHLLVLVLRRRRRLSSWRRVLRRGWFNLCSLDLWCLGLGSQARVCELQ